MTNTVNNNISTKL